ncbi:MAG: hypothetical protein AAF488_06795, partial [Planctomycetota bacterium]
MKSQNKNHLVSVTALALSLVWAAAELGSQDANDAPKLVKVRDDFPKTTPGLRYELARLKAAIQQAKNRS